MIQYNLKTVSMIQYNLKTRWSFGPSTPLNPVKTGAERMVLLDPCSKLYYFPCTHVILQVVSIGKNKVMSGTKYSLSVYLWWKYQRQQNKWYPKGVYLSISKLHSILAVANLLVHNNKFVTVVKFHYRLLQLTAVFLTPFGVTFILLAMVHWCSSCDAFECPSCKTYDYAFPFLQAYGFAYPFFQSLWFCLSFLTSLWFCLSFLSKLMVLLILSFKAYGFAYPFFQSLWFCLSFLTSLWFCLSFLTMLMILLILSFKAYGFAYPFLQAYGFAYPFFQSLWFCLSFLSKLMVLLILSYKLMVLLILSYNAYDFDCPAWQVKALIFVLVCLFSFRCRKRGGLPWCLCVCVCVCVCVCQGATAGFLAAPSMGGQAINCHHLITSLFNSLIALWLVMCRLYFFADAD